MRHLRVFIRRLAGLFHDDRRERELAEEIESNLQMHIADNLRAGMSAAEARRQALIRLGGVEAAKEAYREQRRLPVFDTLLQDIRYGMRGLRRSPGFALTAVLTLALGIGATTAIFSAVYTLLLRPLPYRDPGRLVWVAERSRSGGSGAIVAPDMVAWRERGRPFAAIAGYAFNEYTLTGAGGTVRLHGAMVTANFLSLLGVAPQAGRDFVPADGRPGSAAVALLSDALWRERFSGDPRVVGRALDLDGEPYTVVGVLPAQVPLSRYGEQSPGADCARDSGLFRVRPGKAAHSVPGAGAGAPGILPGRGPRGHRVVPGDQASIVPRALGAHGRRTQTGSRSLAAPPRGRFAKAAHGLAGGGRLCAADRLRQYRQPATGPRGGAPARSSGAGRVGRGAPAPGAAVSHRKHGDLRIGGRRGAGDRRSRHRCHSRWQSPALPWLASVGLDPYVFGFAMGVAVVAAVLFGAAPAITGSRANLMDALKTSSLAHDRACAIIACYGTRSWWEKSLWHWCC